MFLVPGDAVLVDQADEIARRIAGQGRAAEVGIAREELLRTRADVGEVAAPAARDADLLGDALGMIDEQDTQPELTGPCRAEEPGGAGTDDDDVEAGGGAQGVRSPLLGGGMYLRWPT